MRRESGVVGILGLDAAWTSGRDTGVALVSGEGDWWTYRGAASSIAEFIGAAGDSRPRGLASDWPDDARRLIEAAERRARVAVAVVAVDMPMAGTPIVGRRQADNAVSRRFGAARCGTHSPSRIRPGQLSARLRQGFEARGFRLATTRTRHPDCALIEVYPHPAIVRLVGAAERLPYKIARVRKVERGGALARQREILGALRGHIRGIDLTVPASTERLGALKAFEDTLDALVCAWVGIQYVRGAVERYGDGEATIWIPT
jgi:predicted RNase H-like nuclease